MGTTTKQVEVAINSRIVNITRKVIAIAINIHVAALCRVRKQKAKAFVNASQAAVALAQAYTAAAKVSQTAAIESELVSNAVAAEIERLRG